MLIPDFINEPYSLIEDHEILSNDFDYYYGDGLYTHKTDKYVNGTITYIFEAIPYSIKAHEDLDVALIENDELKRKIDTIMEDNIIGINSSFEDIYITNYKGNLAVTGEYFAGIPDKN